MVVTTLCKEAAPLIRYRTRDITRIIPHRHGHGARGPREDDVAGPHPPRQRDRAGGRGDHAAYRSLHNPRLLAMLMERKSLKESEEFIEELNEELQESHSFRSLLMLSMG